MSECQNFTYFALFFNIWGELKRDGGILFRVDSWKKGFRKKIRFYFTKSIAGIQPP